jgi:raffinose/stachyose/melibiose transport system substrate-binding protein
MNLQRTVRFKVAAALAATAAPLALAACGGGSKSSETSTTSGGGVVTDASKLGNVTLTVWDQEVRGGQNATMKKLNQQFQAKYPNIKINRVAKSFTDLQATLKLAASGPNPPDVVEANNGYSAMGPLVKAKLLLPLNKYADAYGWRGRYSTGLMKMNQFTADAKKFGEGNIYGLPMTGEVVGVFYNKAKLRELGLKVPTTFEEFQSALQKAKAAGEVPIQFGNLDKWPGIHEFEEVMLQHVGKDTARNFIFGTGGGSTSFDSSGTVAAATQLQQMVKDGSFPGGYAGLGYDPSWAQFGKGTGVFLISGSWLTADLKKALGSDVGFFLLPPASGGTLTTLGGEGLPWAISSKTKHADAAAAYLDFITNAQSQQVAADNGQLTASKATVKVPSGLDTEVYDQWTKANKEDAIVPYLDWATPTMYDTVTAAIQELMAGKATPQSFVKTVQSDYEKFHSGSSS